MAVDASERIGTIFVHNEAAELLSLILALDNSIAKAHKGKKSLTMVDGKIDTAHALNGNARDASN